MTRHTLATFILLASMPLAVLAAEPAKEMSQGAGQTPSSQGEPSSMFKELDKNHDGQVSQSEAKRSADITARFSTLDTDSNKQISPAEWQAGDKSSARGAAGVSGESREQSNIKGQTAPSTDMSQ